MNYIFSQFPNLQQHLNYTSSYYSIFNSDDSELDYYKFIFDSKIVVIIQINGLDLSLFSYQQPDNVISLSSSNNFNSPNIYNAPVALDSYLPFLNLQDPIYLTAYNFLLSFYPFLKYKTVYNVRYQMIAGTNFLICLN